MTARDWVAFGAGRSGQVLEVMIDWVAAGIVSADPGGHVGRRPALKACPKPAAPPPTHRAVMSGGDLP